MEKQLIQLLSSGYVNIAKLSKYVEIQGKKLERIFRLRQKGITYDEKVLQYILKHLKDFTIGYQFSQIINLLKDKIYELNKLLPGIIDPRVISIQSHLASPPEQVHEINELLRVFNAKLDELLILFKQEQEVLGELHAILVVAQKRNLVYTVKYIDYLDKKLELQLKKQNKQFSDRLHNYIINSKINEIDYGGIGRIYRSNINNNKGVIIYAGTTLHFTQYEPLSYRFALEGYTVLTLNLPSHGNDISFRLGNGAALLAHAVRQLRSSCSSVGAIGFSFGAVSILYNLFSFDYIFEREIKRRLGNFVEELKNGELNESLDTYNNLKMLIHKSVVRAFTSFGGEWKSRGIPDAVIFAGMPLSLYRSKKMMCPSFVSLSYGWMKGITNTFFNAPPSLIRKVINGLERHQPIEEPKYKNKESIYMKFFEINSPKELKALKIYMHDLSKDPENIIPLLMQQDGQYINYWLKKIREIPKLFMYGSRDAIAGGNFIQKLFSKNINEERLHAMVEAIGAVGAPRIYPGIGHTLDERKGFLKKLSRRPQNIRIQNDMVEFMGTYI